ncbi:hypothetical protein JCM8547_002812 [Rhodosporidiobolus lusitaniae]
MDAYSSSSAFMTAQSTSYKAKYRPGKAPQVQRTASMISLPSPPSDCDLDRDFGDDGMDLDGGLEQPPRRSAFVPARGFEDDEEVDQLDSDTDDDTLSSSTRRAGSPLAGPAKRRICALGSPANLVGGGGASRRQLLNPFLPAASSSSGPSAPSHSSFHASPNRPDFPHSSPTRRRRADPDRIKLALTPPQKSREELEQERARQEEHEAREKKLRMMGWDDPENPFVERDEDMADRLKEKKPLKRPETITLVKRGQRISTSVPFTAVLTSTSNDDDPFTFTAPKLLFPPQSSSSSSRSHPSTPPQQSKFLEALRAAGASEKKPAPGGGAGGAAQLPPTPITLKRKAPAAATQAGQQQGAGGHARFGPYKKMKGLGAEGGLR